MLFVEVNVEGDYNDTFNDERYPHARAAQRSAGTPGPTSYGYPYRGQPSVVYALPFRLDERSRAQPRSTRRLRRAARRRRRARPMDDSITDDPSGAPGSGADRLLRARRRARTLDA